MSMKNEVKKFGICDKLGYMFGDFGNDFTFILSSSYLARGKVPPLDQAHVRTGCDRFFPDLSERACGRLCTQNGTGGLSGIVRRTAEHNRLYAGNCL